MAIFSEGRAGSKFPLNAFYGKARNAVDTFSEVMVHGELITIEPSLGCSFWPRISAIEFPCERGKSARKPLFPTDRNTANGRRSAGDRLR